MDLVKLPKELDTDGHILRISKKEAQSLIVSLTNQIVYNDPNTNREEYSEVNHGYFTISVNQDKPTNSNWDSDAPVPWELVFNADGLKGKEWTKEKIVEFVADSNYQFILYEGRMLDRNGQYEWQALKNRKHG